MKIYTKTGDNGTTSLVDGHRVSKAQPRIEAYGTLDELTANLGFLLSNFLIDHRPNSLKADLIDQVEQIVSRVMDCAAIVATQDVTITKLPKITEQNITQLENWCDELLETVPAVRNFTLPVGSAEMSYTHICRTVARRAERAMVRAVEQGEPIPTVTIRYINRLSDYLYALGRYLTAQSGVPERLWRA